MSNLLKDFHFNDSKLPFAVRVFRYFKSIEFLLATELNHILKGILLGFCPSQLNGYGLPNGRFDWNQNVAQAAFGFAGPYPFSINKNVNRVGGSSPIGHLK